MTTRSVSRRDGLLRGAAALSAAALYALVHWSEPNFGPGSVSLALLVAGLCGWLLGRWGGALAGALLLPLAVLLAHGGPDGLLLLLNRDRLPTAAVTVLGGTLTGWLRRLVERERALVARLEREHSFARQIMETMGEGLAVVGAEQRFA